ncbi:hypothetical protein BaRGS_00016924 [Batillaria attramentaria]|uniref:Uncharacterized protein n=1 Tax=Batillaria attramentaria TaxID=370345 RepID=A0ABD0KYJ9_9CAEN
MYTKAQKTNPTTSPCQDLRLCCSCGNNTAAALSLIREQKRILLQNSHNNNTSLRYGWEWKGQRLESAGRNQYPCQRLLWSRRSPLRGVITFNGPEDRTWRGKRLKGIALAWPCLDCTNYFKEHKANIQKRTPQKRGCELGVGRVRNRRVEAKTSGTMQREKKQNKTGRPGNWREKEDRKSLSNWVNLAGVQKRTCY